MFNVGDKVAVVRNLGDPVEDKECDAYIGSVAEITSVHPTRRFPYCLKGITCGWCEEELELVASTGQPGADHIVEAADMVNHPAHYTQGGIECIDALKAATIGKRGIEAVCVANVIKYLWRYEEKNGLEDIKKAKWYLSRLEKEVMEKDGIKSENHQ